MAKPWEKYAAQAQAETPEGPWSKYQAAAKPSGPSEAESGIRSAASGALAGFDDELIGGLGAAGRVAGVKNLGSWKPFDPESKLEFAAPTLSPDEIIQAYRENRDAIRADQKKDAETNPKATIGGNLVGALISPAGKINIGKGAGLANEIKTAAAQGAVFGAGTSDSDLTQGEVGTFVKDTAFGAGTGAIIPPALKATGYAAKKGAQLAGWTGKKAFSATFGVSEQNASKYLANSERINEAKSLGEIKDLVDDSVGKLRDAFEQGKVTEAEAKEALKAVKDQVTRGLSDKKVDAKEALRAADEVFKVARERVLAPLKAKTAPTDRAADVSAMVGELKATVRAESKAAREALKDASDVDLSNVYKSLDDSIERLTAAGTKDALSAASELQGYKADLMKKYWAKIPAQEAKNRIQGLDAITEYNPMQGNFDKAKNSGYKGVRSELDQSLKTGSEEYRRLMKPVAEKAALLEDSNAAFGTPELAVGKLGRLNTPRGEFDRATLGRLEDAVGKAGAVTKEADEFAKAQAFLKDPQRVRQLEQGVPEYQAYRKAMADVAKRNPKWTREQVEQATAKQRRELAKAVSERIFAERRLAPFKGLAPGSTENKIKSVMKGDRSNIENSAIIERLGKESGHDFIQMADDLGVKTAFEGGNTNGSRNTLFWGLIGGMTSGIPGALGGLAFGHQVIDKYGPRIGKKILDGVINIKNSPTVKTIQGLDVPPEVKRELEKELRVFMVMKNAGEGSAARVAQGEREPQRKPAVLKGEYKWAEKGINNLGIDAETAETMLRSDDGYKLLQEASSLSPDSKALKRIKEQIQKGYLK